MSFLSGLDHSHSEPLFHPGFPQAEMAHLVFGVDTDYFTKGPLPAHRVPLCELEKVTPSSRLVVLSEGKFWTLEDIRQ